MVQSNYHFECVLMELWLQHSGLINNRIPICAASGFVNRNRLQVTLRAGYPA